MFSTLLSFTYVSVLAALAVATPAAGDSAADWKYSVGWDGTVLDASTVGDAVGPANFTVSDAASHLEKRTVGGVYICDDVHWGGKCGYAVQPLYTCIKLGSDWNKKISSFGPDPCTFCYAWDIDNCNKDGESDTAKTWFFSYPGKDDGGIGVPYPEGSWNDQISSFSCGRISSCQA